MLKIVLKYFNYKQILCVNPDKMLMYIIKKSITTVI